MSIPAISNVHNLLLQSLPEIELRGLWPDLEPHVLANGDVLEEPGRPIQHVYFIEDGMASVVARINERHMTEVGMIGSEGATGTALLFADQTPKFETFVQLPGSALRISAAKFRFALSEFPTLHQSMMTQLQALWAQASHTALANAHGGVEARLARWLLMMHDRVVGDQIDITHEFLSIMISTRRPGVTVALHVLEGEHYIRSTRGHIAILDRAGLIKASDGLYVVGLNEPAFSDEAA